MWRDALTNPEAAALEAAGTPAGDAADGAWPLDRDAGRTDAAADSADALHVTLREADDLKNLAWTYMDPYAVVTYGGHAQRTAYIKNAGTSVTAAAAAASWQQMVFKGLCPRDGVYVAEARGISVLIEVYDRARSGGEDALIGKGEIRSDGAAVAAAAAGAAAAGRSEVTLFDDWLPISNHEKESGRISILLTLSFSEQHQQQQQQQQQQQPEERQSNAASDRGGGGGGGDGQPRRACLHPALASLLQLPNGASSEEELAMHTSSCVSDEVTDDEAATLIAKQWRQKQRARTGSNGAPDSSEPEPEVQTAQPTAAPATPDRPPETAGQSSGDSDEDGEDVDEDSGWLCGGCCAASSESPPRGVVDVESRTT